jgi:hypothetical protein
MSPLKRRRRARGTGSLFKRADGQWVAAVAVNTPQGKPKRLVRYSKSRETAVDNLRELLNEAAQRKRIMTPRPPTQPLMMRPLTQDEVAQGARTMTLPPTHDEVAQSGKPMMDTQAPRAMTTCRPTPLGQADQRDDADRLRAKLIGILGRTLSIEEMRKAMGLTSSTYYQQLKGGRLIRPKTLIRAARSLGINEVLLLVECGLLDRQEVLDYYAERRG